MVLFESPRILLSWKEIDARTVLWLGMRQVPNRDDVDALEKHMADLESCDNCAVVVEHIGDSPMSLPEMEDFQRYAQLLFDYDSLVASKVQAIIVQTQVSNGLAQIGFDIFKMLCRPRVVMELVQGPDAMRAALSQV